MKLDNIKSTITISLGTKNKLRDIKGRYTYEEFINQLIRDRDNSKENQPINRIEKISLKRKQNIIKINDLSLIYSYNAPNKSPNFRFDVQIEKVRYKGKIIHKTQIDKHKKIKLSIQIIIDIIQKEIDSNFKHKGRMEDYYNWQKEFELLGLSKTAYEEDVLELLEELTSE